jgi:antirestriction protein ArdC
MTSYKPLSERVAAKFATDLKTGNSVFQRPNNGPNAAMPFNIESGNKYGGPSALVLLMQNRDDPRWATSNQANRNHTAVNKGATATWISFMSNYEIQKVFEDGKPVMRHDSKTQRTERVKLVEPKLVEAALFNGEQLRKLDKWEKPQQEISPAERAETILNNSGVNIEHDGDEMSYRKGTDSIVIPEPNQFANYEQYLSEALHQLVHRELENQQKTMQVGMVKPELRTNIASLFLAKEIGLPFELNYHEGYANSWAQVLKDEPGELFKAAEDAQKIVDKVLGFEQQVEQKQEAGQEHSEEQQSADVVKSEENSTAKHEPDKLTKGEVIPYNGTEYRVVAELKNKVYQMEDLGNKRKFKMSSKDELFSSLLNARNNSQEVVAQHAAELNRHEHQDEMADTVEQDFEAENNQYYSR